MKALFQNPSRPLSHYYKQTPAALQQAKAAQTLPVKLPAYARCVVRGVVETATIAPKLVIGTTRDRQLNWTHLSVPDRRSSLQSLGALGVANHVISAVTAVAVSVIAGAAAAAAGQALDLINPHTQPHRAKHWLAQGVVLGLAVGATQYALVEGLRHFMQICLHCGSSMAMKVGMLAVDNATKSAESLAVEWTKFGRVARSMGSLVGSASAANGFHKDAMLNATLTR